MNTKYDAQRALNILDTERASADWAGDTGFFPRLDPATEDDTVPALPALLRPQAE